MIPPAGDGTPAGRTSAVRTFLIADIRGYTRFTQERGDEAAARLAARFAEIVQEGVEASAGELVELRGDEALAVFASARRALRAAVELQEVLDSELDQGQSMPLGVGIGLDAGEAVPVADGYRGGALNLAARLCARAGAGEVLASQGVVHLARTMQGIRFEPLEPLELKGLAQPVQAVRVAVDGPAATRRRSEPPPGRVDLSGGLDPSGPLVGRDGELRWLRWEWRRVLIGHGRVVSLSGPSGIGKTRLAAELARELHAAGWPVLHARCAGPAQAALEVLGEARSGAAPVLVVADDLDVAAGTVLDAVDALVERASAEPIMVLGTHRPDTGSTLISARFDQATTGDEHRRRLGPLDAAGVGKIASLYLRRERRSVPVEALLEQTGGVPLLVHRWVSDWASQELTGRLGAAAAQAASGRRGLRAAEAELAANVVDLQFADERTHLYLVEEPEDSAETVVCPFKGLARFEPGDAEYFFGRERLVAELVARLAGAGLVGVVGPSGSGKSSLVRAGLLPALADGVLPGSDRWTQLVMRPGEHPMAELARAAERAATPVQLRATSAGQPAGDDTGPVQASQERLRVIGGQERLLLVVDQFEEVFTACQDEAEQAAFLATLVEVAQAADGHATVVAAVRADYYGHCAANAELARLLAANHILVGPMDADEMGRAIQRPARRAGLRLESGLADAMIEEVAEEPGGLPLLSCALLESWEHRRGRTLTLAAYQQVGGVRGAVARLAERAWQQLDPDDQDTARRILLRLAGPGEGEAVVRRRVPLDELAGGERSQAVLAALADQRLLTMGEDSVEVAHEALLREWPRLRGWLAEDVQGRALHRHLIGVARAWEQSGRDPGELYRGARLTAALDWSRDQAADLNQRERDFLEASRAAAEREVADARRRAEEEGRRARREARISRRLRAALAGLAGVLVLALVAGGFALVQRGRAERQALVADAGRLGALAQTEDEIDRSALLARQAVAIDDTLERRGDLLAALLRNPAATSVMRAHLDGIGRLSLSADGRLLAMGDFNGRMAIFDVRSRRPLPGRFQAQAGVQGIELSADGSLLAAADQEGVVRLWDVRSATLRHELQTGLPNIGISFSPDQRALITLASDEEDLESGVARAVMSRWDVGDGRLLTGPVSVSNRNADAFAATPDGSRLVVVNGAEVVQVAPGTLRPVRRLPRKPQRTGPMAAALSPDGRTVALGAEDGTVQFLDLKTGRFSGTEGRHESYVSGVAFSADGTMLASTGADRRVIVRDAASGKVRETFEGGEGRFSAARFSPDGRTLYAAGPRSVITWDLDGAGRLGRPFSAQSPVDLALAVSPDGSVIAAPDGPAGDRVSFRELRAPRKARRSLAPGIGRIWAIALAPDGKTLALGGERADSAPVLVDAATGTLTRRMTGGHDDGFGTLAFDPEGKRVLTAGNDGRAIVWDARTGAKQLELRHPEVNDTAAAWSPDGTMVATAGGGGKVVLWRVADRAQVLTLAADPEWVSSVAFSPDGALLATSGSGERFTTLWDVASGRTVGRLRHPTYVVALRFDPRGRTLATAATDGTVRLWDMASQRQVGVAFPGPEQWSALAFDPGGTNLVVLYEDGTGLVWDVDPDRWKERACIVAGGPLTREEWEELLSDRPYEPACR